MPLDLRAKRLPVAIVAILIAATALPLRAQQGNHTYSQTPVRVAVFNGSVKNLTSVPVSPHAVFPAWTNKLAGHKITGGGEYVAVDPAKRRSANAPLPPMPPPSENFAGISFTDTCTGGECGAAVPPSAEGDVGLSHYIQGVDDAFAIYDKSGNLLASFTENSLFSTLGGLCATNSQGSSSVNYDRINDRWILSNVAYGLSAGNPVGPYYQCIAASQTWDPVNGGWFLYAVQIDTGSPVPTNTLPDFPGWGIWNDGCMYYSSNAFLSPGDGTYAYEGVIYGTFSLTDLEAGNTLTPGIGYLNDTTLTYAMLPVTALGKATGSFPATGTPGYLAYESPPDYDFEVRTLTAGSDCGGGGTLSTATPVAQASYEVASDLMAVPQPNTTEFLDFVTDFGYSTGCCGSPLVTSDRLSQQKLYWRNVGSSDSLWVIHGTLGIGGGNAQPQWAQLDVTGGVIATTPVQQGFYAPDATLYRWMPSTAIDNVGDVAIAYSTSNGSTPNFPSISYAGRLVTDPPNTMPQAEQQLIAGQGSQTGASGWGLWSSMAMDEADDCTFWYTNEYYSSQANGTSGDWQTQIGSWVFSSCTPVTNVMAVTKSHTGNFTIGQTGAYTITVSNNGPGFAFGTTSVTDTLPSPLVATAMSGTGWTCDLTTLTCTRSDHIAAGTSFPAITLTVNVPCTATAGTVTNSVVQTGGGDPTSNTATDATTIVAGTGCLNPTTLALASSANPSVFGQNVTFTATLSPSVSSPMPTGTVAFTADGTTIAGCGAVMLSSSLTAQCSIAALAVGAHAIVASYSGDSNFDPSMASLTQVVGMASTSLALASSANPSGIGQGVTFTASLTPAGGPTGTVAFTSNGAAIAGCGAVALSGGVAQCTTSFSALGSYAITANYSGDSNYSASSASLTQQVLSLTSTSLALASSANPSAIGQSVTFTASLTPAGGPTGTVDFTANGAAISGCGAVALSSGAAVCTTSFSTAGSYTIVATYSGDSNFSGSSAMLTQTVSSSTTPVGTFTLSAQPPEVEVTGGNSATYTVTVASQNGFAGDVTLACSGAPADGACSFAQTTLTVAARGSASTTMTVTSTAADAGLRLPQNGAPGGSLPGWPFLAALVMPVNFSGWAALLAGMLRRRKIPAGKLGRVLLVMALLLMVLGMCSCGCPTTRHQLFTINITGTSTATGTTITQSAAVTMVVH